MKNLSRIFRSIWQKLLKILRRKWCGVFTSLPSLPTIQERKRFPSSVVQNLFLPKRRWKFLEKNAKGVNHELEKLINAEAAPSRIERHLKKLNDYEFDCVHALEEALMKVEEEKLTEEPLKEWDEFHSQIFGILVWNYHCCSCQSFQKMCWNGQRFTARSLPRLIHTRNWAMFRSLPTWGHAFLAGH